MTWTLVTGGTGDIGSLLVRMLLQRGESVRVLSRDQTRQLELRERLEREKVPAERYRFFLGDVRDRDRLERAFQGVQTVYHLAALKHVESCEYNVDETIKTNIQGALNVTDAAIACGVDRVIYSSSDKAAEPNSMMGASKLVAERVFTNANWHSKCRFTAARFGNVIGSRGSVFPLWERQIKETGRIMVTDPAMTRFMMTSKQAVELLLAAGTLAGGEVIVRRMPAVKLDDLAAVFIDRFERTHNLERGSTKRDVIGARPGETTSEMIYTAEEATRTVTDGGYFYLLPPMKFGARDYSRYKDMPKVLVKALDSADEVPISREALRDLLVVWGV